MAYSIKEMAALSGLTPRTLRYYDQIGLLRPAGTRPSGYRFYGPEQVDRLQQILFFRDLEFPLLEIRRILARPDFDREAALLAHLGALREKRQQVDLLIETLQTTLSALKGEKTMSDKDKFQGFKQKLLDDNENNYGDEVRQRYGEDAYAASRRKLEAMPREEFDSLQDLGIRVNEKIAEAMAAGEAEGSLAMEAAALHREWLCGYWPDGHYTTEKHRLLADGYLQDPRFAAYYDKIAPGAAQFLRDAIHAYTKRVEAGEIPDASEPCPPAEEGNPEVSAYIESFGEPVRGLLREMRRILREELPGAEERISYRMPTYTLGQNLVHFAGYKGHIGFYPTPEGIEAFKAELSRYPGSKGAVQFPLDEPLPEDLIRRVARARLASVQAAARKKQKK